MFLLSINPVSKTATLKRNWGRDGSGFLRGGEFMNHSGLAQAQNCRRFDLRGGRSWVQVYVIFRTCDMLSGLFRASKST